MNDWETMKERFKEIAKNVKPIQRGEIGIWYDNAGHYCDVIWLGAHAFFTRSEHEEVMALLDDDDNLFGFKIEATPWFDDGENGYTTINLRTKLDSYKKGGRIPFDNENQTDNPIVNGIINVRYDKADYFFDVFWADGDTRYIETENSHILALVDTDGLLCGFRVIHTDWLSDDEHGMVHVRLKTRMAIKAV